MLFEKLFNTPVEKILHPACNKRGIDLRVLRLDQTDAQVSGNKWYKLKYNLLAAKAQGYRSVLSFGGAYSNHIHALAWAGREMELRTIGIIRGESEYANNPTLGDAQRWGMQLQFVNRMEYRQRNSSEQVKLWLDALPESYKPVLVVPEGGSNKLAVKGCTEIIDTEIQAVFKADWVVLPCGTGGTLAGVAITQAQFNPEARVLGIPVLKKADFLYQDIAKLMQESIGKVPNNWRLDLEGHYGGYAKAGESLYRFIETMRNQYNLPLDQVYTGKMMMRLFELIEQGQFDGKKILVLHTGGLQGLRSIPATFDL